MSQSCVCYNFEDFRIWRRYHTRSNNPAKIIHIPRQPKSQEGQPRPGCSAGVDAAGGLLGVSVGVFVGPDGVTVGVNVLVGLDEMPRVALAVGLGNSHPQRLNPCVAVAWGG